MPIIGKEINIPIIPPMITKPAQTVKANAGETRTKFKILSKNAATIVAKTATPTFAGLKLNL